MKKHKFYYRDKLKLSLTSFFITMIWKYLQFNSTLPKSLKQRAVNNLDKKLRKNSFVRLKRFCIKTGRLRFPISQTPYSRISFKENAWDGLAFGVYAG
jgi:ribosomal protein S14